MVIFWLWHLLGWSYSTFRKHVLIFVEIPGKRAEIPGQTQHGWKMTTQSGNSLKNNSHCYFEMDTCLKSERTTNEYPAMLYKVISYHINSYHIYLTRMSTVSTIRMQQFSFQGPHRWTPPCLKIGHPPFQRIFSVPIWLLVSIPLKNMCSSVGIILPNICKNKIHVPNH